MSILSVMASLGVVLALAFLLETIIEFIFGVVAGWLVALKPDLEGKLGAFKKPVIQVFAVGAGIYGAFLLHFDFLFLLAQFTNLKEIPITPYGMVITGLSIGMGSTYVHQFISRFFPSKPQLMAYSPSDYYLDLDDEDEEDEGDKDTPGEELKY